MDPDIDKIPEFLKQYPDPIFEFNKRIIDATKDLCVAYKPNSAFYEAYGVKGLQSLIATGKYIPKDCLSIIDAKRGDIGNTSDKYACAFLTKVLQE
ncbi:orotidine 5'-phosphate decarboxylase / HUMPS family protein [Mucilaginibacter antarcticus]|uniref:orotidine 5'-phosphate decarboxylase / HUMPS family protein n=1 Tax=Mucilaginibacter antarcticus TaxID=1855725 RepID=UPI00363A9810